MFLRCFNNKIVLLVASGTIASFGLFCGSHSEMAKASGVRGVETNEFSRFVDHTLATPWEALVSDIEKALRAFNNQKKAVQEYERQIALQKIQKGPGREEVTSSSSSSSPAVLAEPPVVKRIITIRYQETDFHLEEFHADESTSTISNGTVYSPDVIEGKCSVMENNWICNQMKIREFLLLYPNLVRGSEWKEELRMTILSAFTIAVKSVSDQLLYSVFYTHTLINLSSPENMIRRLDLELIDDLAGYERIFSKTVHESSVINSVARLGNTKCWIRFDSSTYRAMTAYAMVGNNSSTSNSVGTNSAAQAAMLQTHRRHPLFFYDGVRKLYQKKARILALDQLIEQHNGATDSVIEHFTSSVKHIYEYPSEIWTTIVIPHALQSPVKSNSSQSGKSSITPSTTSSSTSKDLVYYSNFVIHQFTQLLASSFHGNSPYHKFMLDKLQVSIEFHELKQLSIIDNDTYSTFLPAKQMPSRWKLTAKFNPSPYIPLYNLLLPSSPIMTPANSNNPITNSQEEEIAVLGYTIWKSTVLQKLVSFFVLVHFAAQRRNTVMKRELTLENTFVIERLFDDQTFEEMKSLLEELSDTLQQTFYGTMFSDELLEKLVAGIPVFSANNATTVNSVPSSLKLSNSGSVAFARSKSLNSTASTDESLRNSFSGAGTVIKSVTEEHEEETIQQLLGSLFCKSSSVNGPFDGPASMSSNDENEEPNYAENWFQLFAIFAGLSTAVKGSTIIKLWQSCMREFQYMFDHNLPISWKCFAPRHQQQQKPQPSTSSATSKTTPINPPVYAQLLWDDVLERHTTNGHHINYPDLSKSIIIQKLQMIQFVSAMQNESLIYESPTTGRDQGVFFPKLFRRVPLTEDIVALQNHIVKKFQSQSKDQQSPKPVSNDNPMLQYQVQLPSLLSDMNCFRAANRDADLISFCKWYGILDHVDLPQKSLDGSVVHGDHIRSRQSLAMMLRFTPTTGAENHENALKKEADQALWQQQQCDAILQNLKEIWDEHSTPMTCDQQKALFSAEKELGKAIAYLDRLPAVDFAFDLVYQAMKWIKNSFDSLISRYVTGIENKNQDMKDISILDNQMRKFVELMELFEEYRQIKRQSSTCVHTGTAGAKVSTSPMKSDTVPAEDAPSSPNPGVVDPTETPGNSPFVPFTASDKLAITPQTPFRTVLSSKLAARYGHWNLFHLLDKMTLIVEDIEITLCKIIQVSLIAGTIHSSPELRRFMLSEWIHENTSNLEETYTLQSEDEVKVLRSMIKSINNRNGRGHDWHSYDGRELGLPHVKEFELKSFSNKLFKSCLYRSSPSLNNLNNGSGAGNASRTMSRTSADQSVSPLANDHTVVLLENEETGNAIGLPVDEEGTSSTSIRLEFPNDESNNPSSNRVRTPSQDIDASSHSKKEIKDFEMFAVTDGNKIRVVYAQVERD